jgi:GWxTD domain-containing protein
MAWALLGLTYARLERWHEAEAVFDSAFARMTPGERAPYDNIGPLLRQAERLRFDQMSPAEQGAARADYWSLTQPLMLTGENEPRTEYYARVTQARLRWSDEWLGHDGAQTARGLVYLRYGPPDMVGIVSRSFITWIYWPARFMMHFILPSGFTNARFAEPSRQEFQQRVLGERGGFDNITLVRELDTIAAQVVQFRGEDDRTALTVFTWVPLARMVGTAHLGSLDLQSAIFVFPDGREGQRIARTETLDPSSAAAGEHRTWRFDLVPGAHLLRIEALARALDRGARHSTLVDVRSYAGAAFTLSDILVARRLAPRDSTPERWMDFFIEPSAAHLTRDDPVSFLWEMYNLRPGPDGLVRWRVELRVQVGAIERREWNSWFLRIFGPALGALGDAVGASALGDEPVALAWEGSRDAHAGGTVVDWITLDFAEAPPGRYDVTLVITDLLSGTAVERTRTLIRSSFTPGQ